MARRRGRFVFPIRDRSLFRGLRSALAGGISNPSSSTQTALPIVSGALAATPFGKITGLSVNPRLIQFALKYSF